MTCISTPMRVARARTSSTATSPVPAPRISPVAASLPYCGRNSARRILPACTRSATRGSTEASVIGFGRARSQVNRSDRTDLRDDPLPHLFGLRAHRGRDLAQHLAQPVHLIDEIENDRDRLFVDAHVVLEVADEVRACEIGVGEIGRVLVAPRHQPAGFHPGLEHGLFDPGRKQKFARAHGHVPVDWRAPACAARHCAMSFSSSGSGSSGNITLSVTYSSPWAPPRRGTPLPLRRSTVPLFDHFGTVMVTGPVGVGTLTRPPSTAWSSGTDSSM